MRTPLKKRLKRDQILFSALSVMNRKGFEYTTMEDISKELDMTKGSLYYYFKNKKDLMYQCHMLVLSSSIEDIETIIKEGNTSEETLRQMVATHIDYAIEEKESFNLVFDPKNTFDQDQLAPVLELRRKYSNLYEKVIQKGIEENVFQVKDANLVKMIILGALNWVYQWYNEDGSLSKSELKRGFGDYVIKLVT